MFYFAFPIHSTSVFFYREGTLISESAIPRCRYTLNGSLCYWLCLSCVTGKEPFISYSLWLKVYQMPHKIFAVCIFMHLAFCLRLKSPWDLLFYLWNTTDFGNAGFLSYFFSIHFFMYYNCYLIYILYFLKAI